MLARMNLSRRKYIFLTLWALVVLSGPIAVLRNTPLDNITIDSINFFNFLQRISGVLLFSLIFTQIILGSQMDKMNQIVGSKAYWFHITQGVGIFFLVLFHPLMELVITYQISESILKALAIFIPRLNTQNEVYLTFGKLGVVILCLTISAGYFRTKQILRRYWHTIHLLNYALFYLVYYHMRVGQDITTPPFLWVTWLALVSVTMSLILKLKNAFWFKKR